MKSLKYRLRKHEVTITNTDWNKYDDRLMKAVERREVDKVAAVLSKKGIIPTKLDVEGRSAFHLAASRGHLDCLNLILGHGVDLTATDATGKSALHLAARNSQSLCVQKLLQHNSPTGNVDLQGKTALHDAVMAGCFSSVKLLCDSGAFINTSDFDGRTPLVLATQMSHPRLCQLLLERGADIRVRDKQNKTALILGCEYGCKDAVEVLLKNGADVTAVDSFGHDSYHYARSSQNPELLNLVKSYLDNATKAKEAARAELKKRQEKPTVEDIYKEELLKRKPSAKEKSVCASEPGKLLPRGYTVDHVNQSVVKGKDNVLVKQSHSLDSTQILQSPAQSFSLSRPLELPRQATVTPSEVETLHQELRTARRQLQATQEESGRFQAALTHKSKECEELVQSRDATKREADRQVQELEGALGDVQKRMLDSEAKVKQLQAHVVAVKEHLGNQALEDMRAQLAEVKVKYEGASAEVGRVRNHLRQSEKALEEYKSSERLLADEVERLTGELNSLKEDRDRLVETLSETEARVKRTESRLGAAVPGEKFDNMKNLLTNAVDEKGRQLAELREDYDRVLEEVAELHRQMDGRDAAHLQEHDKVRTALEEQNNVLKRKLTEVTSKCQSLIREVEEAEDEREMLREELQELAQNHQETKSVLELALEEMKDQLEEATARGRYAEQHLEELQEEKVCVAERLGEVAALSAHSSEVEKDLEDLQRRYQDKVEELECVAGENALLKRRVDEEFVRKDVYVQMQVELSEALEKARAEIQKVEDDGRLKEDELRKVKEESATLKETLRRTLEKDYVSIVEHEAVRSELSGALAEAESRAEDIFSTYLSAQEGTVKLHKEIEEQKKELDTIHEALESKFVPIAVVEEKEKSFKATLKDLSRELAEKEERCKKANADLEGLRQEKDAANVQMECVQQKLEANSVSSEKHKEVEERYRGEIETLSMKLVELEQQYMEVTVQRAELEEQNSLCTSKMEALQKHLESERAHREQFEAVQDSLVSSLRDAQAECERLQGAHGLQAERVRGLEKELRGRASDSEHGPARDALEEEVAELRLALKEEEDTGAQRAEDVATLQAELLRATHTLDELRGHEARVAELQAEKQRLEEELSRLGDRLLGLEEQLDELHQEAARAQEGESMARLEAETLQAKSDAIEEEIQELKERYGDSLGVIGDLQERIRMSAEQTEAKDRRITELLADVERLKQALNGLSQLAYNGNTPNKRNTQHIDTLQAQIKSLQQQLADAERQHREVVSIYRTHLLSAAQGHMDEDVQAALLQIIRMRQQFVC